MTMNKTLEAALDALVQALEQDGALREYRAANEAYLADGELVAKINEYNVQSALLEQQNDAAEQDAQLTASISGRLKTLYDEISRNPAMAELQRAEQALSEVIGEINARIQRVINPNAGEGCGDECAHCQGCH